MKAIIVKINVVLSQLRDKNGKRLDTLGVIKFLLSPAGRKYITKFFKNIFKAITGIDLASRKRNANYLNWYKENQTSSVQLINYKNEINTFSYNPKVSIIVPTYNTPEIFLIEMIESVIAQIYSNWELCIADDCSTTPRTIELIKEYENRDSRIKVVLRTNNGHIAESSNTALGIATGEFCALFDHDDILAPDALYHFVAYLNKDPKADILYSDEDKIDAKGNHLEPTFKMAWSPSNLQSRNYIGHLALIRTSIMLEIGGFDSRFNGSQDYDLYLRATAKAKNIVHIPKITYHWRMHANSVALNSNSKPYAYIAAEKALQEDLRRKAIDGNVMMNNLEMLGYYTHRFKIKGTPLISIIIPSKDQPELLSKCLESIYTKSTWPSFEVIIIDNNSGSVEFFNLMEKYKLKYSENFRCYKFDRRFNFSSIINYGASLANGEYLLLLNNDTEVITPDWMEAMVEQAQQDYVGAVGVKLLFPDNTIQHAGIVLHPEKVSYHIYAQKNHLEYNTYINSINNYSAVTAACLMISKDKFNRVNGFNEDFAVEFNDIDFCLKLIEAGLYNVYIPHAELYHYESKTRGNAQKNQGAYNKYIIERNKFLSKWEKFVLYDPFFTPLMQKFYNQ